MDTAGRVENRICELLILLLVSQIYFSEVGMAMVEKEQGSKMMVERSIEVGIKPEEP